MSKTRLKILSPAVAQVQSLVWELRSHIKLLHVIAKKITIIILKKKTVKSRIQKKGKPGGCTEREGTSKEEST